MKDFQSIPKSKIFTREQLKAIRGGDDGYYGDYSSSTCVYCEVTSGTGAGSTSCWYSSQDPSTLCSRVYPNGGGYSYSAGCASACHMN